MKKNWKKCDSPIQGKIAIAFAYYLSLWRKPIYRQVIFIGWQITAIYSRALMAQKGENNLLFDEMLSFYENKANRSRVD